MPEPERDWKAELRARRYGPSRPPRDSKLDRVDLLTKMLAVPLLGKRTRRMIQAELDLEKRREK